VSVGAVSNLDNLGVGVAFGIRGRRIDAIANAIIAGITMTATAAAVIFGQNLLGVTPAVARGWLAPVIVIGIGTATVLTAAVGSPRRSGARIRPDARDHGRETAGIMSRREAVVLGVALSVNNLGTGVAAGAAGLPGLAATTSAGLLSLACLDWGSRCGTTLGRLAFGSRAQLVAGLLLLAVGTAMLPNLR
jgi:putative sporulation protein YtaF